MSIEDEVNRYMGMLRDCLKEESLVCDPEELGGIIYKLIEVRNMNPKCLTPSDIKTIEKVSNKYGLF
jgi:hypothetical protein